MHINVFPDFLSSGLWNAETNASIAPSEIKDFENSALHIALKYWLWTWEFSLTGGRLSPKAAAEWLADGERLVVLMNAQYGEHQFEYQTNLNEVVYYSKADGHARI